MDRLARPTWIVVTLAAWCAAAQAQNNSLLRRNSMLHGANTSTASAAPTTQPAQPPLSVGAGIGARPVPPALRDPAEEPPPNPVLLASSPYSYAPPRPKKFGVHDLVTIIIRESRTSLNDAKSKSDKDWKLQAELAKWFRLDTKDHLVQQDLAKNGAPGIDWDMKNTYEGQGKYDRKDELTTRITAKIIDVKPNGNLVLEARKEVTHSGDDRLTATLTGECRAADVTAQNTVLSTQIADLKIDMQDTGAVRDATRRGWLMRLFDLTRPF